LWSQGSANHEINSATFDRTIGGYCTDGTNCTNQNGIRQDKLDETDYQTSIANDVTNS
jgi:hypothetical protein